MAEYIDRAAIMRKIEEESREWGEEYDTEQILGDIEDYPAADVVERKTWKNVAIEYDDCDQFVCSECGIELQDWHRVERDEDDGDVTYHEYRFRFCPHCGAQMIGGDEDV